MMHKRFLGVGAALVLLVLLIVPGAVAQDRTNFIYVRPQEIVGLDPALVTESQSGFIIRNVYSRLVDIAYDGNGIEADLAESWEVSDDGLVYTFHLRPGVKFHDGSTLTASDVVYSLQRFLSIGEGDSSTYTSFLTPDSAVALDDQTVEITLTQPFSAFLEVMGIPRGASIVSQAWVEANATEADPWATEFLATNAMGTGPYVFGEWIPNEFASMTRFEDYYGGPAPIAEVISLINEDDTSTRLMMERGEVDAVQRLPEDVIRSLAGNPEVVVYRRPSESSVFWAYQLELEPFNDVRVRQAIIHAIDYDALLDNLVQDGGFRMNSPVYAGMQYHNDDIPLPERDIELAKSLLADAGYPEGLDIDLIYVDFGLLKQIVVVLQANLAEAGIRANVIEQPFGPFLDGVGAGEIGFYSWVSEPNYPQALAIVERFHSDFIGTGLGGNISYYNNPDYDAIIDQIRAGGDEVELAALYDQAQQMLIDDAVWMLLYQEQLAQVTGSWVQGFDFGVYNYLDMRDVSISR
ncbi:MAG: ABC transporter substrate-binding protein [Chloroflexi bacterium]|nr:ABC transporter substrate-binding protein [Chloroflexota bacterium]